MSQHIMNVQNDVIDIPGFQDYQAMKNYFNVQAEAEIVDGFAVRKEFSQIIGHYIRNSKDLKLWPILQRKAANADLNREIIETDDPNSGFVSKTDLSGIPGNPSDYTTRDISDPGQQNKALGGRVKMGHYALSLLKQQNRPYGEQIAERTNKLVDSVLKRLEKTLFWGDADTNPLEFNGLEKQMAPNHSFSAYIDQGEEVTKKLRGVVRHSISHEKILRGVTHIFTSALGVELLENEADARLHYQNLDEITPGLSVPAVTTQNGELPVINSPFLQDTEDHNGYDWVHYYLIDMDSVCWKGVIPQGGDNTFNPQIFDVRNYNTEYLIEERLCIIYGTLHALNRGQGIWKLSIAVPVGTVGQI